MRQPGEARTIPGKKLTLLNVERITEKENKALIRRFSEKYASLRLSRKRARGRSGRKLSAIVCGAFNWTDRPRRNVRRRAGRNFSLLITNYKRECGRSTGRKRRNRARKRPKMCHATLILSRSRPSDIDLEQRLSPMLPARRFPDEVGKYGTGAPPMRVFANFEQA